MMHTRRYTHSSSFKMAALFTVLLGASALLLGYYLADFSRQNITRETEAAIDSEMAHILSEIAGDDRDAIILHITQKAVAQPHPVYVYLSADGKILAGQLENLPSDIGRMKEGMLQFAIEISGKQRQVAAKIHSFADGSRLLIARDISEILHSHQQLKWITGFILFFMLVVVSVSFLISHFVVSRINRIALTAGEIMDTGDLSRRIPIAGRWDDLSNLAQILNQLFARIESLMDGIRDVSDSIAHDLRTPLTRLRNQLESARNQPLSDDDIQRLLAESDQLLATFHSLLRIANIEKGKRHQAFEPTDLQAILRDVVELYEPLAEDKQIRIITRFAPAPAIQGDRDLLFQLFANLLDNAVKFSGDGSNIEVTLQTNALRPEVIIADEGEGIAYDEYEKVFERFYRADKSRSKQGSGLGLSLVKATAELHKARIRLQDNAPGLRVSLHF